MINPTSYQALLLHALQKGDVIRKTLISGPSVGCEELSQDGQLLAWRYDSEPDWETGEVLTELLQTDVELVICGGGHIALELATYARRLGYHTTIIDERKEYCNHERFPSESCLCAPFEEVLECKQTWIRPYFVIATRGHMFDQVCLQKILNLPHRYIGMIGSKTKVAATFSNLLSLGFTQAQLDQVHSPIGLPIKAVTAAEIAISILAQIIQTARLTPQAVQLDRNLLTHLAHSRQSYVLARVIEKTGSAPCEVGFQLVVFEDGTVEGTIGGGAVEAKALETAKQMQKECTIAEQVASYSLSNAKASELGMICGGMVRVLFQRW